MTYKEQDLLNTKQEIQKLTNQLEGRLQHLYRITKGSKGQNFRARLGFMMFVWDKNTLWKRDEVFEKETDLYFQKKIKTEEQPPSPGVEQAPGLLGFVKSLF